MRALGDIDELNSAIGLRAGRRGAGRRARGAGRRCSTICSTSAARSASQATSLLTEAQSSAWKQRLEALERRAPAAQGIHPARRHAAPPRRRTSRAPSAGAPSAAWSPSAGRRRWAMLARRYLNRLSDLLFVAGRRLNRAAGGGDVQWKHKRKP